MKKVYSLILVLCTVLTANAFTPQLTTTLQMTNQLSPSLRHLTAASAATNYAAMDQSKAMAAAADTIRPKATIAIQATNLEIMEMNFYGYLFVFAEASNDEYAVLFQFLNPVKAGSYTNKDFLSGSPIVRLADNDTIKMKNIVANVSFDNNGRPIMIADVLGSDSILYKMDLRFVLPEVTKTVLIDFETPCNAQYLQETGEYYIFNSNEDYAVQIEIFEKPNQLNGEYDSNDFYMHFTLVGEIENGDTTVYAMIDAKAIVTPTSNGMVKLAADLLTEEGVLYKVTTDVKLPKIGLEYDATEGSVNRSFSSKDQLIVTTDYVAQYGELYVDIVAADKKDILSMVFLVRNVDKVIGVPEGRYPINKSAQTGTVFASPGLVNEKIYPSFYGKLNASGNLMPPCYFLQAGEVVVEKVNDRLKLTVDAVNSYDVPVHIVYEADGTSVENVDVKKISRKLIKDNQLLIIKDGVQYNVVGNIVE